MPKTSGSGLVRVGVDVGREDRLMTTDGAQRISPVLLIEVPQVAGLG